MDAPAGASIFAGSEERMPLEPAIYADRRRRLMTRMGDRAAAIFFAAPEAVRSNDTHFDYRQSSALLLHEMRLFKTGAELASLRRAVEVSADAHLRAMKATKPGVGEWEIQAEVEYAFRRAGARAPGYTTIAGSGPNACVLHYVENRRRMQDGDLLLLDAGAELDHYTGDVTRTWP